MNTADTKALITLCLMAASADGAQTTREQDRIGRFLQELQTADTDFREIFQAVSSGTVTLEAVVGGLGQEARARAYEMAVAVCRADEVLNDAERAFLGRLRAALDLPDETAAVIEHDAQQVAAPPLLDASPQPGSSDRDLDQSILKHSILAGALELLPQSLATLAILPLQMRLVYNVGRRYGFELDRGHLKDFLAVAGVGLTSQVVEGFASRLISGFAGLAMGKLGRRVAGQVTGSALAFATTYALGQAARQYYAGGRQLAAVELRRLFDGLLDDGRRLQGQYLPQIQEQARSVRLGELLPSLNRLS